MLNRIKCNTWCSVKYIGAKQIMFKDIYRQEKEVKLKMHRFVMNGKFNIVDHIIGNGLDCIKCNLRDRSGTINHLNGCMRFDNSCGLCWDVKDNAWRFRWSVNKTRYNKNFNVIK